MGGSRVVEQREQLNRIRLAWLLGRPIEDQDRPKALTWAPDLIGRIVSSSIRAVAFALASLIGAVRFGSTHGIGPVLISVALAVVALLYLFSLLVAMRARTWFRLQPEATDDPAA